MTWSEKWENAAVTENVIASGLDASRAFRVHILITKDEEGTYSAVALNLPGAGSCGETRDESLENAVDAIRGVLQSYGEGSIPWRDSSGSEIPFGAEQKWIVVHA